MICGSSLAEASGGRWCRDKLFYFYAYDQQMRDFPAISTPDDPNFYALTPTQRALLGNRGVTPAKVNAALNYLDSLTGTIARRQDQTINFGKVDWQAAEHHRVSVQYDRARSSSPAGVRSAPVVDRRQGEHGQQLWQSGCVAGAMGVAGDAAVKQEVRVQYGRDLQYERAQAPLPQEPAVGPGGFAPEVAIGPDGFRFGSPPSLGRRGYPDETKVQLADMVTWTHGRHQLQIGVDLSLVHDDITALTNTEGAFHYDSTTTSGTPVGWWTGLPTTRSM